MHKNAGRNIVLGPNREFIEVRKADERKFKIGDKVVIKQYNEKEGYKIERYDKKQNQVCIIEDTEEAGWNYKGVPKYGLRGTDGEWVGDYLEDEIEVSK